MLIQRTPSKKKKKTIKAEEANLLQVQLWQSFCNHCCYALVCKKEYQNNNVILGNEIEFEQQLPRMHIGLDTKYVGPACLP